MSKSYSGQNRTAANIKAHKTTRSKRTKTVVIKIQPMMPNNYTALERERLRAFEKKIMTSD